MSIFSYMYKISLHIHHIISNEQYIKQLNLHKLQFFPTFTLKTLHIISEIRSCVCKSSSYNCRFLCIE